MKMIGLRAATVAQRPGAFALQVLKAFRANQGLLLAGAVAYYALLSIVPLLILIVIALSHLVDPAQLLHRHPIGPYAGRELQGEVRHTWLRGVPIADGSRDGRLLVRKDD